MDTLKDLLLFIKERKKWWLLPVLIFLLLIGLLLISTSNTVIAPFIYTLFWMSYELDSHIQENTYGLDSFRKPVKQDHQSCWELLIFWSSRQLRGYTACSTGQKRNKIVQWTNELRLILKKILFIHGKYETTSYIFLRATTIRPIYSNPLCLFL